MYGPCQDFPVGGAHDVAAQEFVGSLLVFRHLRAGWHPIPGVARADQRSIAKLHHAGILRTGLRVSVDQLRGCWVQFSLLSRTHQYKIAVRVGVRDAFRSHTAAVRRAPEGYYQFAGRPADDGGEGAVEVRVLS